MVIVEEADLDSQLRPAGESSRLPLQDLVLKVVHQQHAMRSFSLQPREGRHPARRGRYGRATICGTFTLMALFVAVPSRRFGTAVFCSEEEKFCNGGLVHIGSPTGSGIIYLFTLDKRPILG